MQIISQLHPKHPWLALPSLAAFVLLLVSWLFPFPSVPAILASALSAHAETTLTYLPLVSRLSLSGEVYFSTLPPGSILPSGEACAALVKARTENKGMNLAYNAIPGNQGIAPDFFPFGSGDPRLNTEIGVRVDGEFTGTTDEILQWAACKWGIDENMVRTQAAIESWWHQDTLGDWTSDLDRCAPGHEIGVDGQPGLCPESFGILQNRYPYEQSAWPGIAISTAFNADLTYAIWRACFEGYEWWLNDVEHGEPYAAGDAWGCFGRWFSGRWHTPAAETYIANVQDYLDQRIWEAPYFQEP